MIKFANSFSCGQPVSVTPTPTPAFEPDTNATFREPGSPNYGISMDLKDVDGGRFGLHCPVFYNASSDPPDVRMLFVNPTRRMYDCPWDAQCDTIGENGTSVWVCTLKSDGTTLDRCESYGYMLEDPTYDLMVDSDITRGFWFRFGEGGTASSTKHVQLTIKCDNLYPEGHMMIDPIETNFMAKGAFLEIVAEAKEACIRPIPTTAPLGCAIHDELGEYTLDLDMSNYNKEWKKEVMVKEKDGETGPMDLIYKPCHGMLCPDGYDCDGAEDALVWLCEKKKSMLGHVPFCTGYGLHENNLRLSVTGGYMFAGVDATMKGENKRGSVAHWQCNTSLSPSDLYIESPVHLSGKTLRFDVHASQACPTGSGPTPTPQPPVAPRKPQKGTTPSPTPEISPNPIDIIYNDTHYIYVNLEHAQMAPLNTNMQMAVGPKQTVAWVEWSSWEQIPCPKGWDCGEFTNANLWVCWLTEDFDPYCHPVADKYVPGQHTRVSRQDDLDHGIHIIYEGQYGVNMEIIAQCDPNARFNRSISLRDSVIVYQSSVANGEWTFNTTSGVACAHRFEDPPMPTTPRDPPSGGETQTTDFEYQYGEDRISFNVKKMQPVAEEVFLGVTGQMHRAEIHFSPYDLIKCPKEGGCGVYANDEANVWKCVGRNYEDCYPIGDRRYGLEISPVNTSNIMAGLIANYNGGAQNSEIHFQFQCNYSVPYGEITFDETGVETRSHIPIIYAHTRHACPNHNNDTKMSGGGIFLLVVFGLAVAYFGVGTLIVFIVTGSVAIPFEAFWAGVGQDIVYAVTFIFTCAKASPTDAVSYDKI